MAAVLQSGQIRDFRDPRYSNYLSMHEPTLMSAARSVRISPLYEVTSSAGA